MEKRKRSQDLKVGLREPNSYPGQEDNFGEGRLRLVKSASRDLGVIG